MGGIIIAGKGEHQLECSRGDIKEYRVIPEEDLILTKKLNESKRRGHLPATVSWGKWGRGGVICINVDEKKRRRVIEEIKKRDARRVQMIGGRRQGDGGEKGTPNGRGRKAGGPGAEGKRKCRKYHVAGEKVFLYPLSIEKGNLRGRVRGRPGSLKGKRGPYFLKGKPDPVQK